MEIYFESTMEIYFESTMEIYFESTMEICFESTMEIYFENCSSKDFICCSRYLNFSKTDDCVSSFYFNHLHRCGQTIVLCVLISTAIQETGTVQRRPEKVQPCEQESVGPVCQLLRAKGETYPAKRRISPSSSGVSLNVDNISRIFL